MSSLLNTVLVLLTVYGLGFLAAIPVGAGQIEIARRTLAGFFLSGLCVVFGSMTSDAIYGSIAFFGLAMFLKIPTVEAVFWLVNALLTLVLGVASIREARQEEKEPEPNAPAAQQNIQRLGNTRAAYVTGFSLAFTNPMMIAWWLLAARILKDLGLVVQFTVGFRIMFILAGVLGIGSYLTLLTVTTYRAHKSITKRRTKKVTLYFGAAMILLAIYFIVRAIMVIQNPAETMPGF